MELEAVLHSCPQQWSRYTCEIILNDFSESVQPDGLVQLFVGSFYESFTSCIQELFERWAGEPRLNLFSENPVERCNVMIVDSPIDYLTR